jgi:protein-S-isoprenylcysteine O-methyltransferase Ste14
MAAGPRRDVFLNIAMVAGVVIAPLAFAPQRLAHPAPWVAVAVGLALLFTQPPLEKRETLAADAADRMSALGIFAAAILTQLVSVLDFGYLRAATPVPAAATWWGALVLLAAALAFRVWAIRTLGRFFTANVRVLEGHRVVATGPYRLVRHPSYTGAILVQFGLAWNFGSGWGALAALLLVLPSYAHRITVEERALVAGLGEEYERYRARTKRLIPFVF